MVKKNDNYRNTKNIPIYRVQLVREGSAIAQNNIVKNPGIAVKIFKDFIGDIDREVFVVAMLDIKNKVIGINNISMGSLNCCIVHPREVLKPAILVNAASIIICHNHPSGDPEPSQEDIELTSRIEKACSLMGILLQDHIVIGHKKYVSLKQTGQLE